MKDKTVLKYFDGSISGQIYAPDSSGFGRWVDFKTFKNSNDPEDDKIYFLIMDVILPSSCVDFVKKQIKEIGEKEYPGLEVVMLEEGRRLSPVDHLLKNYNN